MEFMIVDKNIQTTETEDNVLQIVGIANTGQKDLVGDVLTTEALIDICKQATNHNLHLDHDTSIDGVLGPIVSAELTSEGVEIRANIVNTEYQKKIRELLENGANLGLSVSGVTDTNTHNLTTWDLTEISLTPIPCDQGTMGSVRIAKSFAELIDKQKMEKDKMAEEVVAITKEEVIELINEAFNERREEFLETIRQELKQEYDVAINELRERVDSLETSSEEVVDEEVVEEEVVEEEPVATEDDVVEDGENFLEGIEEAKAEAEAEAGAEVDVEEDEEEEEEEVDVEKTITDILNKKLEEIFTNKTHNQLHFKYETKSEAEEKETTQKKKAYTPRELAQMLSQ